MNQESGYRRKVDPYFRKLLLKLTVEYLSQNPADFLDFALDFFNRTQRKRVSALKSYTIDDESSDEEFDNCIRRASVYCGDGFDPVSQHQLQIYPKSDFQKKKLMKALDKIVFFNYVLEEGRRQLVDAMEKKDVLKGHMVIKEGDIGDFFYIVEAGEFEAFRIIGGKREVLKTYRNGGFFGELALLYNSPRASSVQALSEGVLWAIDRATFRRIALRAESERCQTYERLLGNVPLLAGLSQEQRRALADCLEPCVYGPGQRLVCEGESPDGMYFVVSGTARVTVRDRSGRHLELKTLAAGDYFGELALITHRPRAASVYAANRVQAAFLHVDCFHRLLGPCIDLMQQKIPAYEVELEKTLSTQHL